MNSGAVRAFLPMKTFATFLTVCALVGCDSGSFGRDSHDGSDIGTPDIAAGDAAVPTDAAPEEPPLIDDPDAVLEPPEDPGSVPEDELPPEPPEPDEDITMEADEDEVRSGVVERNMRVMHWNVAGGKIHRGSADRAFVHGVVDMIERTRADFVSLNELCGGQFDAIRDELARRRWPNDHRTRYGYFAPAQPPASTACRGRWLGNAIFSRRTFGAAQRFDLPRPGSFPRTLVCARLRDLAHMRFCGTHLTHLAGAPEQLSAVLRRLEQYNANGDTVLFAGDLNMRPPEPAMNTIYAASANTRFNGDNRGRYRELDDRDPICLGYGERTTPNTDGGPCGNGGKIDYIFARENRIIGMDYTADTLDIPMCGERVCSDHRIVEGRVRVRIRL